MKAQKVVGEEKHESALFLRIKFWEHRRESHQSLQIHHYVF